MKVPEKLKPYWDKIPKFYKDLGIEACYGYVRRKASGRSTSHWTYNYGGTVLAFWTDAYPRRQILNTIATIFAHSSPDHFPRDHWLETVSFNKPWTYNKDGSYAR